MTDKELEAFKELQVRLERSQRNLEELKRNGARFAGRIGGVDQRLSLSPQL